MYITDWTIPLKHKKNYKVLLLSRWVRFGRCDANPNTLRSLGLYCQKRTAHVGACMCWSCDLLNVEDLIWMNRHPVTPPPPHPIASGERNTGKQNVDLRDWSSSFSRGSVWSSVIVGNRDLWNVKLHLLRAQIKEAVYILHSQVQIIWECTLVGLHLGFSLKWNCMESDFAHQLRECTCLQDCIQPCESNVSLFVLSPAS